MNKKSVGNLLLRTAIAALALAAPGNFCCGAPPKVENVTFGQRQGTGIVDVNYDLSDPDNDEDFAIGIDLLTGSSQTFRIHSANVSGDIGPDVKAGKGKHIVWNAADDVARGYIPELKGKNFIMSVTADDKKNPFTEKPKFRTVQGGDGAEMVLIPAGEFQAGSAPGQSGPDELPSGMAYLDAFLFDTHEVTNGQFAAFLNSWGKDRDERGRAMFHQHPWGIKSAGDKFSAGKGFENYPVIFVTWFGARQYCKWAGERMPTEAEWEKACKAGKNRRYVFGNDAGRLRDYSWYKDDSDERTHSVGGKQPSVWGIYDANGNAGEWVSDWYDPGQPKLLPYLNPQGPASGRYRIVRGGTFNNRANLVTCTTRNWFSPDWWDVYHGFRCAATPKP